MSVPRSTEMTVRSLLQKELEKRGVKVTPEVSFVTPVGRRMTPDLVLRNSGDYVVETKLVSTTSPRWTTPKSSGSESSWKSGKVARKFLSRLSSAKPCL